MGSTPGAADENPLMALVSFWSNFDQKMPIQEKNKIIFPEKQALYRRKSEKNEKKFPGQTDRLSVQMT